MSELMGLHQLNSFIYLKFQIFYKFMVFFIVLFLQDTIYFFFYIYIDIFRYLKFGEKILNYIVEKNYVLI